jgi:hypothetical protein
MARAATRRSIPGEPRVSPAALLRLAAVIGRTDTALGVFYRQLSARTGKVKAITATARSVPSSN